MYFIKNKHFNHKNIIFLFCIKPLASSPWNESECIGYANHQRGATKKPACP